MNPNDDYENRSTILDKWSDKLVTVVLVDKEVLGMAILKDHDEYGILFETKQIEAAEYNANMSSGFYSWSRIYCIDIFRADDTAAIEILNDIMGVKSQDDSVTESKTIILPNDK